MKLSSDQVAFTALAASATKCERNIHLLKVANLKEHNTIGAGIVRSFLNTKCILKVVDFNKFDKDRDQASTLLMCHVFHTRPQNRTLQSPNVRCFSTISAHVVFP